MHMKRYTDTRLAPTVTREAWGKTWTVNADEIGIHKGVVYASREVGDRALLRVARVAHDCASGVSGVDVIQPGDVYIETLSNGSRNSGWHQCIEHAVAAGDAFVNPPLVKWDGESRTWVDFDPAA